MSTRAAAILMVGLCAAGGTTVLWSCAEDCKCGSGTKPYEFHLSTGSGVPLTEFELTVVAQREEAIDYSFTCPEGTVNDADARMRVDCYDGGVRLLPLYHGDSLWGWELTAESGADQPAMEVSAVSIENGIQRSFDGIVETTLFAENYRVLGLPQTGCCSGPRSRLFHGRDIDIVLAEE